MRTSARYQFNTAWGKTSAVEHLSFPRHGGYLPAYLPSAASGDAAHFPAACRAAKGSHSIASAAFAR